MAERSILVSCGSCGELFGRLADEWPAERLDAHFQICTDYLRGEGLMKEKPIVYAFEDDD